MPNWKGVPTLKTLSLRRLAWPDAVNKAVSAKKAPTVETYTRYVQIKKYFEKKRAEIKRKRKHNIHISKEPLRQITEDVVNAWIRLSNFYETRLNEIHSMSMFMQTSTIGTLDFLHEGFTLRDEKNFLDNIFPYIGVIPYTLKPQNIDHRTWLDLVNVMVIEGICETLEKLYIPFGSDRTLGPSAAGGTPALSYRFDDTLIHFTNLRSIIVRGSVVGDGFMLALGENCFLLQHLDVRGTRVTERGVALLLFRKLGKRFFKGTFLPSHCRFACYPKEILQPCCATLKYLDVSDILCDHCRVHDLYITRACPQLRATPLRFYFNVPGESRVVLRMFNTEGVNPKTFRQHLIQYSRLMHCERVYDFFRVLLNCMYFEDPCLEVLENGFGEEIAFLFISGPAILVHCELQNLTVFTLVSYARNALNFIPLDSIAKFAPKLQKLKASLSGTLSDPLKSLRYVCAPVVKDTDTLRSLLELCPQLEYLEVRDILTLDTERQFGSELIERIFARDPGAYVNLEVLRFLFRNKILLYPSLSWITVRCPSLKIIGDLSVWGIPFDTLMRTYANTSFYNYAFAIEYKGILHYCDRKNKLDLARFE